MSTPFQPPVLPRPIPAKRVYGPAQAGLGRAVRWLVAAGFTAIVGASAVPLPAAAETTDAAVIDARDALRKKDRLRLAADRVTAAAANHPLAMWVEYWEITNRIGEVLPAEIASFDIRWAGSYLEDRLRNDWLLELGRRRDWVNVAAAAPRFRMNDDREVTCYALVADHLAGKDVREAALAAWFAQKEADDGCALLATTLTDARRFTPADAWRRARFAVAANRPRVARQAAQLVGPAALAGIGDVLDSPVRYLAKTASTTSRNNAELTTLALIRQAGDDPDGAAEALVARWDAALPADLSAVVWAEVGKQSALKLLPTATDRYQRAALRAAKAGREPDWPDETLAWKVRAALRADGGQTRWQQVTQAIDAMPAADQRDPAWVYWKARSLQAMAATSQDGDSVRALATELLQSLVAGGDLGFYPTLAAEALGQPVAMPPKPAPLSPAEREAAGRSPGLARALLLITLGLRNEGVREWNYMLRGMNDRELLAAAQLGCDREIWDRCINTSDRTKTEIDVDQRYPTPYRKEMTARAREIGLDPAYVYGLIRQESRFNMDARSSVGASGLMQIMPATARWTAKKIGLAYTPELIADRDTNLRLGTAYLKLVLDDFGGSQAMAAAAYNAGPGRPRRWREGASLETAAWAENIPFAETRDYVKKVLANASYYATVLGTEPTSLKARLGRGVGPADPNAVLPNRELP
jgi:soluble lytic murein transglycosylase